MDIDIALDRIRVGTNGMGALNKLSRRLLVYAGDSHGERGRQHKPTRVVAAEANQGDNFDVAIGKMAASLAVHVEERILKTGSIASGEELLWVGCIALASERLGQGASDRAGRHRCGSTRHRFLIRPTLGRNTP